MIITLALIILAAFAKAVMDTSAEGSIAWKPIDFWKKEWSWQRKWKVILDTSTPLNVFDIAHDENGRPIERFPLSSTVLVFLTDGWHLAQAVFLASIFLLIVTYEIHVSVIVDFLILRVLFGAAFEGFYRLLKG